MSVQSAMRAAVSGLAAQSSRMGSISDNIANSQTVGYKRSVVNFSSMVVSGNNGTGYQAGGVSGHARTEVSKLGLVQAGSAATDMAIAGDGFFVVSKGDGGTSSLTRAGSFRPDNEGNLRNSAGYYLMGWPVGTDGNLGSVDYENLNGLQRVNTAASGMSAVATTGISFTGNVPSADTGPGAPTDPFSSSIEYYDALGNSQRMHVEWLPSTTTPNNWTLTVTDANKVPYGSVDVEFSDSNPGAGAPMTYSNVVGVAPGFAFDVATGQMSINAAAATTTQPITVKFGTPGAFDGVTQFSGEYSPKTTKNGSGVGTLQRVEISENGYLIGVFSNNARRALWQIPLATVTNPDGLAPADGNTFNISAMSGDARLNDAGNGSAGLLIGGALEGANVDIAEELTDMITTQRAFSTNAKTIQTADEMLEEVTRLKR